MSNITNNKLSATLTAAQISAVKTAINTIKSNLPMLIGLTTEERQSIPKIDVNNKVFVEDTINAMESNPTLLPAYFNTAELKKDLELFQQLEPLLQEISKLHELIDDTKMLAGSEAYVTALAASRNFAAAATAGIPGADSVYDTLKARFATQSSSSNSTNNNTPS